LHTTLHISGKNRSPSRSWLGLCDAGEPLNPGLESVREFVPLTGIVVAGARIVIALTRANQRIGQHQQFEVPADLWAEWRRRLQHHLERFAIYEVHNLPVAATPHIHDDQSAGAETT
jgi:hypothetical protein